MSVGRAPELAQAAAREAERIRKAEQEDREHATWYIVDESDENVKPKAILGSELQRHIGNTREDYLIYREGESAKDRRYASAVGFSVPAPVSRGEQTVARSFLPTSASPEQIDAALNESSGPSVSPEELALEMLPDGELHKLAVANGIDIPLDAYDRKYTIQALLKASVSPNSQKGTTNATESVRSSEDGKVADQETPEKSKRGRKPRNAEG